ncbi:Uma2 family endonuclease [Gemmata sp.]|uniref:Uma2 family endonuclease n=1 Tax=Gemmata sp. TaxID=1914242 RepID=UPI003F71A534
MTFATLSDLLARFADYPPERVRLRPVPGTATKQDVVDIERREGKLCELIDGVLVEKAAGFKESLLAAYLIGLLDPFARGNKLGIVLGADGTVELFPGQVRIPDVAFYSWAKLPGGRVPDEPVPELHPDLAIEVLSKSNTRGEMFAKRKDYFFAGVRLVWYVDPRTDTVTVYTSPDQSITLTHADTMTGGDVLPGFSVRVADIFSAGQSPA